MRSRRLCIFLVSAPLTLGVLIWALTLTGALHPSLRSWALATNLVGWLPLPGTVGDILTLDFPRGSWVRRCLYWGAGGGAMVLGLHFLA